MRGLKRNSGDVLITGEKVSLRVKRLSDAQKDYAWQTNPELARLDAMPLLVVSLPRYLLNYANELRRPTLTRHQFAVETLDGDHIGNCTYYNVDAAAGEAELGIMIGDSNLWDKGYGSDAVMTLVRHIFRQTELKRIYLKTLDWNHRAQQCFLKCGFTPCGRVRRDGYNFVFMELHRKQWAEQQEKQK